MKSENSKPHRGGLAFRKRWLASRAAEIEKNTNTPAQGELVCVYENGEYVFKPKAKGPDV